MPSVSAETKWQRRKDARPEEIREAALALFAERGFAATKLDDVAERAGVSKGTVYLYFDSKEDLFRQVVLSGLVPNIEAIGRKIAELEGPVLPVIEAAIRHFGGLVSDSNLGAMPKLIVAEAGNFPALAAFYRDEVILRVQGVFARLIEKGIQSGEIREVPVNDAARILMAPLFLLAVVQHLPVIRDGLDLEPKSHVDTALTILFEGLAVGKDS